MESYVIETNSVTSSDGVTVKPHDTILLKNGNEEKVFWVGIHKPSYLSLIGVRPNLEKGAVCFRQIKRRLVPLA